MYTAYDFWRDLMELFGDAEKAKAVAIEYLDCITAQERIHDIHRGKRTQAESSGIQLPDLLAEVSAGV